MATTSTRKKGVQPAQSLSRLLWWDTLLEWGVPLLLGGVAAVAVILGAFDLMTQSTGVATVGWSLLLLIAFLTFRPAFISARPQYRQLTLGFGVFWAAVVCAQLFFVVFTGPEVTATTVSPGKDPATFSLAAPGTVYDLVVAGTFASSAAGANREGGYRLSLEKEGHIVQTLDGVFSEHLMRQRLGRRGSTTSLQVHNHVLHHVQSAGEGVYQLKPIRVDPLLQPALQVTLYRDIYPERTFWLIDVLLLLGAYFLETWQDAKGPALVLTTGVVVAFLLVLHDIGAPSPSYRQLVGAGMMAGIVGSLGGWAFRLVADTVRRRIGRFA